MVAQVYVVRNVAWEVHLYTAPSTPLQYPFARWFHGHKVVEVSALALAHLVPAHVTQRLERPSTAPASRSYPSPPWDT